MSQCVPDWDLDDVLPHQYSATAATRAANVHNPPSEYGLSELTWREGQLARHGLHGTAPEQRAGTAAHKRRQPGDAGAPWEKPLGNGTLEAVVDQATRALVPGAMDALVPSARLRTRKSEDGQPCLVVPETASGGGAVGACVVSCGGRKRARHGTGEGDRSVTGSAASVGLTLDWCPDGAGFTTSGSPPSASPETDNTSGGRALMAVSEGDDSCYSRRSQKDGFEDEKSGNGKIRRPVSSKRIRAAAVHNQSERKRRDKINQRMRTLQKLVPNSSKTDKASILDEVIDYMKQLQAQVQVMNRMSSMAPPMMMPVAMQQMGMAMMAQMAQMAQMGAAMGMGMADAWQAPWGAFLPSSAPRDLPAGRDNVQAAAAGAFLPDPFAAFLAFHAQQQPMSAADPHSRMTAMHQQQYQQPPGPSREGAERS